jgi:hypothetical protein
MKKLTDAISQLSHCEERNDAAITVQIEIASPANAGSQ